MKIGKAFLFALVIVLSISCGKDELTQPESVDISGTWSGLAAASRGGYDIVLKIKQNGSELSGSGKMKVLGSLVDVSCTLSGNINDSQINFTLKRSDSNRVLFYGNLSSTDYIKGKLTGVGMAGSEVTFMKE